MSIQWDAGTKIDIVDKEKWRRLPSLCFPVIWLLDLFLARSMHVFEWGSGGSTLFFGQRCHTVVSIEHDPDWYEKVSEAIKYHELKTIAQIFIAPEEGEIEGYGSARKEYRGKNFKQYVDIITQYPDESFDCILVDGRSRSSCLRLAVPKLKPGGIMVLDDANRMQYRQAITEASKELKRLDFRAPAPYLQSSLIIQTSVWLKR